MGEKGNLPASAGHVAVTRPVIEGIGLGGERLSTGAAEASTGGGVIGDVVGSIKDIGIGAAGETAAERLHHREDTD